MAAGADPGELVRGLRDRILAAFPGKIRSLYLLGSRALGREIETSDVDLAVLFHGEADRPQRQAVEQWAESVRREGGVMVDATVLDEPELARGLRPYLKIGRWLAGEDVLFGLPLRPAEELIAYYGHLAAYFIWAVRGRPAALRHPLGYPAPEGEYCGYERHGIRTGENQYAPGFAQLVNSVCSVANFRLARAGEFCPSKSLTVATYERCLPGDPWLALVREVYSLGRTRWQGRIPDAAEDRRRLADCCRQVLAFENEGLRACLLLLPRFAALPDEELRQRTRSIAAAVSSAEAAPAAAVADAKARL